MHTTPRRTAALLLTAGLSLTSTAAAQPARAVPVGEDTTVLTEPLRPDGGVDYATALHHAHPTPDPDDNAYVAFLATIRAEDWPAGAPRADIAAALNAPEDFLAGPPLEPFGRFAQRTYRDRDFRREVVAELRDAPWPAKRFPEVEQWLNDQRPALDAIRDALDALEPAGRSVWAPVRWSPDGTLNAVFLQDQLHLRAVVELLVIDANRAAHADDWSAAWASLRDALRLAAAFSQGQSAQHHAAAADAVAAAWPGLARLLGESDLPPDVASDILNTLDDPAYAHADVADTLTAEHYAALDAAQASALGDPLLPSLETPNADAAAAWMRTINAAFAALPPALDAADAPALAAARRAIRDAVPTLWPEPAPEPTDDAEDNDAPAADPLAAHTGTAVATLLDARAAQLDAQSRLAVARAAAAVHLYHADNEAFPAALDKLLPDYLDAVPTDPQSAGPLRYDANANANTGFRVYSLGPDGQDDLATDDDPAIQRGSVRQSA